MKKSRRRVAGKWAGMCASYIAKLAGVTPLTARRFLYQFGKAKNNTVTIEDIRHFIFQQEAQKIAAIIRKDLSSPLANDFDSFLSRSESIRTKAGRGQSSRNSNN